MSKPLTDSVQDYLKIIYELTQDGKTANTNALATRLGIAPASVTGMVQNLSSVKPALVTYRKHQGVTLTAAGERAALEVIRHHRLIEAWLVQALGYSWDEVHEEAEKLEHVISEGFEMRIAAALGNPDRDPHGEPIPNAELVMPADKSTPLSSMQPEQEAIVRRVDAQEAEFLRYMEELGLIPGASLKVLSVSTYDEVMHIQIQRQKQTIVLGPAITSRVFIEIL
ncbi:MAG TPA: metal-dependent transcriptional regulator [Anaerolineales bacterium]|nr:metal-dependent transcriptional regulator [Anaerolineales bacterium]